MRLLGLSPEAHSLVTQDLASGATHRYDRPIYDRFLEELETKLELDAFDETVNDLIASTARHDTAIDSVAAPAIHRALPISRREASHAGVWRFLAVVYRPDFVRHRWENRSWTTTQTRYWSPGTRPDSNAFSRLWWIAELTRDGDSYDLTTRVFARQALATQLFVRGFSQVRVAIEALVLELHDEPPATIERIAKELSGALSTLVLEALDLEALRALVRELRAAA